MKYSCSSTIVISGPTETINSLLTTARHFIESLIEPHNPEELAGMMDVESKDSRTKIRIFNISSFNPPKEAVQIFGDSFWDCDIRLEYINSDHFYVGILDIIECKVMLNKHLNYRCRLELHDFDKEYHHLDANVLAWGMRDMPCYYENELNHKYQVKNTNGDVRYFKSLKEALQVAEDDTFADKISWYDGDNIIRMSKFNGLWKFI